MPRAKSTPRKETAAKVLAAKAKAKPAASKKPKTVKQEVAKPVATKPPAQTVDESKPRQLKQKWYKRWLRALNGFQLRLPRRTPKPGWPSYRRKLPPAFRLFIQACKVPAQHWEVFGGLLVLYAAFNILLIGGLTGADDLVQLKNNLAGAFGGHFSQISTGLTLFSFLVTSNDNTAASGVAQAYSTILLLLTSLAIIWGLRQVYSGHITRVRDTLYNGMRPLIQSVLVLIVVGLEVVPAVVGGFVFGVFVSGGILQGVLEISLVSLLCVLLFISSLFMLCSSVFALYIVTLPDMTPWRALKSANQLVRYRRAKVLLKLLFLPLGLIVSGAVIIVPFAIILTPVATVAYYIVTILAIVVVHSYMYAFYRELIAE